MEQDFGLLPSLQIKKGIEQLNLQNVPNCSASLRDPTYRALGAWSYLTGEGKAKLAPLARESGILDTDTPVHRFHQMPANVHSLRSGIREAHCICYPSRSLEGESYGSSNSSVRAISALSCSSNPSVSTPASRSPSQMRSIASLRCHPCTSSSVNACSISLR
jgi:hypothetical protein